MARLSCIQGSRALSYLDRETCLRAFVPHSRYQNFRGIQNVPWTSSSSNEISASQTTKFDRLENILHKHCSNEIFLSTSNTLKAQARDGKQEYWWTAGKKQKIGCLGISEKCLRRRMMWSESTEERRKLDIVIIYNEGRSKTGFFQSPKGYRFLFLYRQGNWKRLRVRVLWLYMDIYTLLSPFLFIPKCPPLQPPPKEQRKRKLLLGRPVSQVL